MAYQLHFGPIWEHRGQIAEGLLTTIGLSACGLLGAVLIGAVVGSAGASARRLPRLLAVAYVEGVRNVPLLLHIYLWFLGLAALDLPAFLCATLGLSIYSGAYAAEIVRARTARRPGRPGGSRRRAGPGLVADDAPCRVSAGVPRHGAVLG